MNMDKKTQKKILSFQHNEITEHFIYAKLARSTKNRKNKEVLKRISDDELRHYNLWKKYSQKDITPNEFKIWKYFLISKIFGLTFGIKLMERGEGDAKINYGEISRTIPEAIKIADDEDGHEKELLELINEEKLKYVGSMVLGLNDALVELTGALAGLTFALKNTALVATAGFVTGIAASFSMAASEYLSTKSEGQEKNPLKASFYTGLAYIFTVLFLIFSYLFFENIYVCLSVTLFNAVIVIYMFTFYISVAKGLPFRKRFLEMVTVSLGVAFLSFIIGLFVRQFLNVEI